MSRWVRWGAAVAVLASLAGPCIVIFSLWLHESPGIFVIPAVFIALTAHARPRLSRPLPPEMSHHAPTLRRVFDTGRPPADASLAGLVYGEASTRAELIRRARPLFVGVIVLVALNTAVALVALLRHEYALSVVFAVVALGVGILAPAARRATDRRLSALEQWAAQHIPAPPSSPPTGQLRVERPTKKGRFRREAYVIEVDGLPAASVKPGSRKSVNVAAGRLAVRARVDWLSSPVIFVDIDPVRPVSLEVWQAASNFDLRAIFGFAPALGLEELSP